MASDEGHANSQGHREGRKGARVGRVSILQRCCGGAETAADVAQWATMKRGAHKSGNGSRRQIGAGAYLLMTACSSPAAKFSHERTLKSWKPKQRGSLALATAPCASPRSPWLMVKKNFQKFEKFQKSALA